MTIPDPPYGQLPYGHSTNSSDIACDLEAHALYSKFYRYKLEMFNFPNDPAKFGIYQMQSYFR